MAKKKARLRKKLPAKTKKKVRRRKSVDGTGSTGPRLR